MTPGPVLSVDGLTVSYRVGSRANPPVPALHGFSLEVRPREVVALVGPSGCGKTTAALAILGLLPPVAQVSGSLRFRGAELSALAGREWERLRGRRLAYVPQDDLLAWNPVLTIGAQVAEVVRRHERAGRREAWAAALRLLGLTGLSGPDLYARRYPHQLSGGMRRRALLAMALAAGPELVIADEPTAGLDPPARAGIVRLLRHLRLSHPFSLLLITHDRELATALADRTVVMGGETAGTEAAAAGSPAGPVAETAGPGPAPVLLEGRGLISAGPQPAVAGVDLSIRAGEVLALVGESGCGKSTLARLLACLEPPTAGRVLLEGTELTGLSERRLRVHRGRVQMIFQDPHASLDPRLTVAATVAEPLRAGAPEGRAIPVERLLAQVGIDPGLARRYPHQLSGGQRQRVALARALASRPSVLLADEPTASLDQEAKERLIGLILELKSGLGLGVLFISHDLGLVSRFADRIAVMCRGRIVEEGSRDRVTSHPLHPYTDLLLQAAPALAGVVPTPGTGSAEGRGCGFRPRCPVRQGVCAAETPELREAAAGHRVACHVVRSGGLC